MISKFFIERPVLANVLAILMVVIGAVALMRLAVAQYPNVVPPTISVTTRYPGASARAVVDTVALPIEQQVNGVDGMIYMQSWSAADGSYTLIVTFKIGMDINFAQVLVQNRVSSALAQLPQAVQAQGVTVQQKSTAILQFVTLTSPDERYDSLFLANYATISLQPELARLPGVGQVNIFGAGTSKSPPASSACRRGRTRKPFSTPSTSPAASTMSASSRTSWSRPKRTGRWSTCATSGGSSWGRRPTARSSRSTASPRRASAFFRRSRRTRSTWRAKSPRRWTSS
jgi:hypothetical protein